MTYSTLPISITFGSTTQSCLLTDTIISTGSTLRQAQDEDFWNQAKRHLRKYNGIPKKNFDLFLKECEWRFNYGPPDQLLKTLRKWLKPYQQ